MTHTQSYSNVENKSTATPRFLNRAEEEKMLYGMIGGPTHRDFVRSVQSNAQRNNSVTPRDSNTVIKVYGRQLHPLLVKLQEQDRITLILHLFLYRRKFWISTDSVYFVSTWHCLLSPYTMILCVHA